MDQHWNAEVGPTQGVSNRSFIAEIGQRYDDAIDFVAMRAEEISAESRLGK